MRTDALPSRREDDLERVAAAWSSTPSRNTRAAAWSPAAARAVAATRPRREYAGVAEREPRTTSSAITASSETVSPLRPLRRRRAAPRVRAVVRFADACRRRQGLAATGPRSARRRDRVPAGSARIGRGTWPRRIGTRIQTPDRAGTDDEHSTGGTSSAARSTRELDPDAVVIAHRVGKRHAMARAQQLRQAPGAIRSSRNSPPVDW